MEVETNKKSITVDPYACAIRVKHRFFDTWVTVGHIPREISRHVYFFIKVEGGLVHGHVLITNYRHSSIPAGGLEIPLLLTFSASRENIFETMKQFVETLYDYNFTGKVMNEDSEECEIDLAIEDSNDGETLEDKKGAKNVAIIID